MSTEITKMPYVRLGKSGLKISKVILGCMSFGSSKWQGWVLDEKDGIAQVKEAVRLGINTFDTSDFYSNGLSEVVLGKAIKELELKRDSIVVMTKLYMPISENIPDQIIPPADQQGYPNRWGLSRKHIFNSVQISLKRLQLDYIDIYICHRFDYDTPIEETMQALHDVVKAGWVRYIGMSSCHAYQFHQMQNYAITHNLTPFISMQNHYSLVYREEEREMMPTLDLFGVGSTPWSPLGRGTLTRPWAEQQSSTRAQTDDFRQWMKASGVAKSDEEVVNAVEALAKKKGVSMAQIGLAWLMSKPTVSAPVIGTSKTENLKELVGAIDIKLTPEEIQSLEAPYIPRSIFGHF